MKTLLLLALFSLQISARSGTLTIQVHSDTGPVSQVEVRVNEQTVLTNDRGEATIDLPEGPVEIRFHRIGFADRTQRATVNAGQVTRIEVELEAQSVLEEEIVVTQHVPTRESKTNRSELRLWIKRRSTRKPS